jgi:hypothetical protein
MTHIATKPLNYNHLRLYSLREDAGPASPALQKLIDQPREITLKTLAETLRASNITDEEEKWRLSDPLRLNLLDDFGESTLTLPSLRQTTCHWSRSHPPAWDLVLRRLVTRIRSSTCRLALLRLAGHSWWRSTAVLTTTPRRSIIVATGKRRFVRISR